MSPASREFAIIIWNENNNLEGMLSKLPASSIVTVFWKKGLAKPQTEPCTYCCLNHVEMPEEVDNQAKSKNFVINYFESKNLDSEAPDVKQPKVEWLHVLEDNLDILKSPTPFIEDLEAMMKLLDINSWLSTTTDIMNFVYKRYYPRVKIILDKPEYAQFGIKELNFCSHSNTQWMVFNLLKADKEELTFRQDFNIAMFWIIEYLARRRNSHPGSMYFMNQYLTVSSEQGVFKNKDMNPSDKKTDDKDQMAKEDKMFRELNVNYTPDNNIDQLLEKTYEKLNSKISK